MPDDNEHRQILDRANRMLNQSKTLRRLADELLSESNDLRRSVKRIRRPKSVNNRKRKT